jgi:hypothetical protein
VVIAHTEFDNKWFWVYNRVLFSQKELAMGLRYDTVGEMITMNESQKRDIRMYGCTEAQMREAVEQSITFRHSGPAMMAASLMSDAQEMINTEYGDIDYMRAEDARQALNRAKWILFEYCDKR